MAMEPDAPNIYSAPPTMAYVGAAFCLAGCLLSQATVTPSPSHFAVIAVTLATVGLVLAGRGIMLAPRSVPTVILGGLSAFLATGAIHPTWDSIRLLTEVMVAVAIAAVVVLHLPRTVQRALATLVVIYHFLGVISAITSPSPSPWISSLMWTRVFRPHLVFTYVNNAYQFYSPEPGAASLLWICVETKDSEKEWIKLPRRPETRLDPLGQQYTRRLSIVEFTNQNESLPYIPIFEQQERNRVANHIKLHPDPRILQYRLPQENTKRTIRSYARHIAHEYGPERIKSIKIYRVFHEMLEPSRFARGEDPFAKTTYFPFFLGEFDGKGDLIDPKDPLLYWLIPILPAQAGFNDMRSGKSPPVDNYLAIHAGSDPFADRDAAQEAR